MAKQQLLRLKCCECSLVHNIAFAIEENGKLGIAMERNQRATIAQRKKHRKPRQKKKDPTTKPQSDEIQKRLTYERRMERMSAELKEHLEAIDRSQRITAEDLAIRVH